MDRLIIGLPGGVRKRFSPASRCVGKASGSGCVKSAGSAAPENQKGTAYEWHLNFPNIFMPRVFCSFLVVRGGACRVSGGAFSDAARNGRGGRLDATDRQIDRLVYELYGLTEEKIR